MQVAIMGLKLIEGAKQTFALRANKPMTAHFHDECVVRFIHPMPIPIVRPMRMASFEVFLQLEFPFIAMSWGTFCTLDFFSFKQAQVKSRKAGRYQFQLLWFSGDEGFKKGGLPGFRGLCVVKCALRFDN
jgi:hypothetical protein